MGRRGTPGQGTAKFDTYKTKDPSEGVDPAKPKDPNTGFHYKTVPHITSSVIANCKSLDPIFEKHEPVLKDELRRMNDEVAKVDAELREKLVRKLIAKHRQDGARAVTDADQRRWLLPGTDPDLIQPMQGGKGLAAISAKQAESYRKAIPSRSVGVSSIAANPSGQDAHTPWREWEVPFDTDPAWPQPLQDALTAYRQAWRAKMDEVNACIEANAEQEELVDQPEIVRGITRVSGPFTVESVRPLEDSLKGSGHKAPDSPIDGAPHELEVGRDEEAGGQPCILAENLWLLPKSEPVPRGILVQHELAFPSVSSAPRRLIKTKTPKGWTKTASKTRQGNAYFKDERTAFNLQIRNPATKSALSTLPEDEVRFPLSNWFKNELAEHVQKIMLRSEMMLFPVSPLKGNRFAADGSNLPQVVQALRKDAPSWKGWLEHVRTVLPIRNIEVEELEANRSLFLRVEYDSGHKVQSWHLSDGTLRLLALTLLAYTQNESAVYLIEEPENGVHPQAIEAVYHSLSSLVDGQALVATHSPVLVAQVEPSQLLCFSKTGDETDIVRGDLHPKLRDWKGKLNLSHLYAAGVLS